MSTVIVRTDGDVIHSNHQDHQEIVQKNHCVPFDRRSPSSGLIELIDDEQRLFTRRTGEILNLQHYCTKSYYSEYSISSHKSRMTL